MRRHVSDLGRRLRVGVMNARLQSAARRSFLLTDWITASSFSADVIQDSEGWLELPGFADATFVIEVSQVANPTSGCVLLYLETAPFPDEAMFTAQPVAGPVQCAASSSPIVARTASGGSVPLCRYVRWRAHGTTSNAWSVTFVAARCGCAPTADSLSRIPA